MQIEMLEDQPEEKPSNALTLPQRAEYALGSIKVRTELAELDESDSGSSPLPSFNTSRAWLASDPHHFNHRKESSV